MSLRLMLLSAVTPLLLLAVYLAGQAISSLSQQSGYESTLSDIAAESRRVSDLVHELQKERGYSAGFTSSSGANFADALATQRGDTDAALVAYRSQTARLAEIAPEAVAAAGERLEAIAARRAAIDDLALTVPELAGYYTGMIRDLMAASSRVRLGGRGDRGAVLMEAAELVALAKESAGLERAMGATGLGGADFAIPVHRRFADLGAQQRAFLAVPRRCSACPDSSMRCRRSRRRRRSPRCARRSLRCPMAVIATG